MYCVIEVGDIFNMLTSSRKNKGRTLCKMVKQAILETFTNLAEDDIKVTSSGATGEDLQFSPLARQFLPISIECKNKKAFAVVRDYEQAVANAGINEPVLVIKENRGKPLVLIDLNYLLFLLAESKR